MRQWIMTGAVIGALALALLATWPSPASAQAKVPGGPIQFIVPWAAGGGTDRIARMVAGLLEKELGQPVTVINRTGGGGMLGHSAGATAAPDGQTITMVTVELAMLHWTELTPLRAIPTYKDFTPVALLNVDPAGVQVATNSQWRTLRDLLGYVKSNPGKIWAAGAPKGGVYDLARAGMLKTAGIPVDAMPFVPSTGAAPALEDLVAGRVQVVTASLVEGRPLINAGKVRALANMAEKRDPAFPNVPTLKELGLNWSIGTWRGIALPKGTSPDIVAVYERALARIVRSKEFVDFMNHAPFAILYKGSADFSNFLAEQDELMGVLMKEAGVTK